MFDSLYIVEVSSSVWGNLMDVGVALSHLLIVISSSSNFLIYCWNDIKFRKIISRCFRCFSKKLAENSQQKTFSLKEVKAELEGVKI